MTEGRGEDDVDALLRGDERGGDRLGPLAPAATDSVGGVAFTVAARWEETVATSMMRKAQFRVPGRRLPKPRRVSQCGRY